MKKYESLQLGDLVKWVRFGNRYKSSTVIVAKVIALYPRHCRIQVIEDNPYRIKDPIVPNSKLYKMEVS
jgi:hypothetical protein